MRNAECHECAVCGSNRVREATFTEKLKCGRRSLVVGPLHRFECDECGAVFEDELQNRQNQIAFDAARDSRPEFITPGDVARLRSKYDLTQEEGVKIFGGGPKTFSKWERGVSRPATPTAKLLRLALENPDVMFRLARMAGIELRMEQVADVQAMAGSLLARDSLLALNESPRERAGQRSRRLATIQFDAANDAHAVGFTPVAA